MRSDIIPGGVFPDYALPDHTGTTRTLAELQAGDPLVLVLARGDHCAEERRHHLDLAAAQSRFAVAYTQLVTVSTDDRPRLEAFRAAVGAHWPFLSDHRRRIQEDLDIADYTDPVNDPMVPHTLVLEPGLVIHTIYNGHWFWGRPSLSDLWQDLRAVTAAVRPDWDLGAPGLREVWKSGDREPFDAWNRRRSRDGRPEG